MQTVPWFRLDNAALVFPAVADRRHTTMFRISATLAEPVDLRRVSRALERLVRRTPYFQVELRRGFFWYFFEANSGSPRVMPDSRNPCLDFRLRGPGRFPYRVRVYGSRIALEISHILTDGTGALRFLRSLVSEYLAPDKGSGTIDPRAYDLLDPDEPPEPEESADSFRAHYRTDIPPPRRKAHAWRAPIRVVPDRYYITTGRMPAASLTDLARSKGVKLTALLVGFHLYALALAQESLGGKRRPLRVLVPVNMRKFFSSRTMRNFFLYVDAEVDPRLGSYSIDDMTRMASKQMELSLDRRELSRHMTRNVGSERHPVLRLMPRGLKDLVLSHIYRRINEPQFSGSLSNLGPVHLPDAVSGDVAHFDFIPPPSPNTRTNCGVISFGNTISVSWGSTSDDRTIEREFFRALVAEGVPVDLETNYTTRQEDVWPTVTAAE